MKAVTALAAAALASTASAQLLTPPRTWLERQRTPHQIGMLFSASNWSPSGDPLRTGGALFGEFTLSKDFTAGFWFGTDEDSEAPFSPDQSWADLHATYLFKQDREGAFGVTIGGLSVEIEGFDTARWGYLGLTGSTALDANARGGSRWTLGYNVAWLSGEESASGLFVISDGTAYGINLDYKLSRSWSLGAMWWTIDLDNGTTIDRSGLGASFRF